MKEIEQGLHYEIHHNLLQRVINFHAGGEKYDKNHQKKFEQGLHYETNHSFLQRAINSDGGGWSDFEN